jgi:hypothetical protein
MSSDDPTPPRPLFPARAAEPDPHHPRQTWQPPQQQAGMGDVWAINAEHGVITLALSPEMAAHVRDAAYHLADDPIAVERYGERAAGQLEGLADALADLFDVWDEWAD